MKLVAAAIAILVILSSYQFRVRIYLFSLYFSSTYRLRLFLSHLAFQKSISFFLVTYGNLSSPNAYLTIKGSYKPCSWHVVKNQPIDLCQDATSEGGATCPGDGTYTMEVAEIKLDEGFADFSGQNITFTFTFADDNGNEIGCTNNNVIYSSAQLDDTVETAETQFAATEEETSETDESQNIDEMEEDNAEAMGSGTYISMTAAAFVGVAISASIYRVRTQRRMSTLDKDDKKVPFTVDMRSLA